MSPVTRPHWRCSTVWGTLLVQPLEDSCLVLVGSSYHSSLLALPPWSLQLWSVRSFLPSRQHMMKMTVRPKSPKSSKCPLSCWIPSVFVLLPVVWDSIPPY
uniref:Uncharacterized protein n=1 Tax=Cacopsylla melanoneura TaxID=428564 RepID=A0A8D8Y0P4_9HEMI